MPEPQRSSYDLHLHSCWSYDALAPVDAYFEWAQKLGMRLISVTEHHVMDNLQDVLDAASRFPDVRFAVGGEFTVHTSIGAVDLVCHGLPTEFSPELRGMLDAYHDWQRNRGAAYALGMRRLGFPFTDEARKGLLESYRPAHVMAVQGLTHVKNLHQKLYFIERGWIADDEGYGELGKRVADAVDLPKYPRVEDVVPVLHRAGAVVAVAHPTNYFLEGDRKRMDALREEINFDGVECAHRKVPPELSALFRAYCQEHGMYATGGSDCHQLEDIPERFAAHGGAEEWLDEFMERVEVM